VRKLILKMSVSVDGFAGGPEGQMDWMFPSMDAGVTAWIVDTLRLAGVHIMGSRTFHDMAAYWPSSTEPFAAPMNDVPKVVFSKKGAVDANQPGKTTRALEDATRAHGSTGSPAPGATSSWIGARVARGDLAGEIERMKAEGDKDILAHGGASFARSLVATKLVDELRLIVHPVVLGRGLALFSGMASPLHLTLVSTTKFNSGAIANVYHHRDGDVGQVVARGVLGLEHEQSRR
jgi:dihydrofolate reductase